MNARERAEALHSRRCEDLDPGHTFGPAEDCLACLAAAFEALEAETLERAAAECERIRVVRLGSTAVALAYSGHAALECRDAIRALKKGERP